MIEIEENTRLLHSIKEKIKELGESLWHSRITKGAKRIRRKNIRTELLEWPKKLK